jgi:hypothetical protein
VASTQLRSPLPSVEVRDSSNVLRDEDSAVHAWYRFVLSFPPHLVREYLDRMGVDGGVVLDPFCGTGTTVVEAKKMGLRAAGVEASPMAHFAATVKTSWGVDHAGLLRAAKRVAHRAHSEFGNAGMTDSVRPANVRKARRTLDDAAAEILITDSISPAPLHKVLVLVDAIRRTTNPEYQDLMMLAVARLLPGEFGNLRFGPEVGLGEIKTDAQVIGPWMNLIETFASDLSKVGSSKPSRIFRGDARGLPVELRRESVGAVFTSPPYPNEKDYTRTTRLESVILGFYNNKTDLRVFKQSLLRSNTRNIYVGDVDADCVKMFPSVLRLAAEVESRRLELGKTSGFEKNYHKVVLHYFGGMARHLESLRPKLRPGARLGYVVGDQASFFRVLIQTGELLAEVAERLGYEVESLDLFRTRLATATRAQLREEVLVLRWNGGR